MKKKSWSNLTHRNHFPTKSTGILHLWISDGDGDEVVGSLVLFLFFLLPLCVLLAIHPSPTVALSLSLLLVWFWRWNCREEQVSTYGIKLCKWYDSCQRIDVMWWKHAHPSSFHVVGLVTQKGSSDMKLSCGSAEWSLFFITFLLSLLIFLFVFFSLDSFGVAKERRVDIQENNHIYKQKWTTAGTG